MMAAMAATMGMRTMPVLHSCRGLRRRGGVGESMGLAAPLSSSGRVRDSFARAGVRNAAWRTFSVHAQAELRSEKGGASSAEEILFRECEDVEGMPEDTSGFFAKAFLASAVALAPLVDSENAFATGGQFGLLEGRTIALIHPIVMGGLLVFTLYAGFLGWQWRRVRTIQTEITELKKQVKPVAVPAGEKSGPPPPPSPVEAQISALTEERKELVKGGYKDRHFNAGSILLGSGVTIAIAGCVNTWMRTGKLFPGPHLFAGAGIVISWALAASLVPAMQKGNDGARTAHIGLNVLNVLLFIWQIPTGWEIVEKVFQFTTWP